MFLFGEANRCGYLCIMNKMLVNVALGLGAIAAVIGGYMTFAGGQQVRELPYFEPIEKGLKTNVEDRKSVV